MSYKRKTCNICSGTGQIQDYSKGQDELGRYINKSCYYCSGSGWVRDDSKTTKPPENPPGDNNGCMVLLLVVTAFLSLFFVLGVSLFF